MKRDLKKQQFSSEDLVVARKEIDGLKKRLFELRMSVAQGNDKMDTSMFGKIKRDVARLKFKFGL